MRIALGIIAIVLFVFVASRYGVQKKQAELCELEAMRTYPDRSTARPGHCHVNRKFAGQMTMAATVHAATVAWRHVSIA
jgi:hypothetical protein